MTYALSLKQLNIFIIITFVTEFKIQIMLLHHLNKRFYIEL
jgi:hypothetical protein